MFEMFITRLRIKKSLSFKIGCSYLTNTEMRKIIILVIGIILSRVAWAEEYYVVEDVVDCSTVKLTNGKIVYMMEIECSETQLRERAKYSKLSIEEQSMISSISQKSEDFVKNFLRKGSRIKLEMDDESVGWDRIPAYFYIPINQWEKFLFNMRFPKGLYYLKQGKDSFLFLNATLISSGYASLVTYSDHPKYSELFKELFGQAKINKRGLMGLQLTSKQGTFEPLVETTVIRCGIVNVDKEFWTTTP